ncbi:MAG: hypothetical protein K0U36_01740 [Alphaproteobacteria bacterium]|nr:hypothetical protein [Alphaproteobacteria bacterium]
MRRIRLLTVLIPLLFASMAFRGYEVTNYVEESQVSLAQFLPSPSDTDAEGDDQTAPNNDGQGTDAPSEAGDSDAADSEQQGDSRPPVTSPSTVNNEGLPDGDLLAQNDNQPTNQRAAFRDDEKVNSGLDSLNESLRKRELNLDQRAEELSYRELLLELNEARIQASQNELQVLDSANAKKLEEIQAGKDKNRERLVSIFTSMKAKDAAEVFNGLDTPTIIYVLNRMATRNVGPIIAEMNPEKAREVTQALQRQSSDL